MFYNYLNLSTPPIRDQLFGEYNSRPMAHELTPELYCLSGSLLSPRRKIIMLLRGKSSHSGAIPEYYGTCFVIRGTNHLQEPPVDYTVGWTNLLASASKPLSMENRLGPPILVC